MLGFCYIWAFTKKFWHLKNMLSTTFLKPLIKALSFLMHLPAKTFRILISRFLYMHYFYIYIIIQRHP